MKRKIYDLDFFQYFRFIFFQYSASARNSDQTHQCSDRPEIFYDIRAKEEERREDFQNGRNHGKTYSDQGAHL